MERTILTGTGTEPAHARDPREVARALGTDLELGLRTEDADARLAADGPNELPPPARVSILELAARQLIEPMALLLVGAALVSWVALDERIEGAAIAAIVLLNATIGVVEERRAQAALDALGGMETPRTRVRRDGATRSVASRDVVVGDVVVLRAGDRLPADVRIASAASFEVDEAPLTGESLPVAKRPDPVDDPDAALGDRTGTAFSGTLAVRGAAEGVVVATGARTVLGAIAAHLSTAQEPTPLQRELARLTTWLGGAAIVIALAVFGLLLLRGTGDDAMAQAFLGAVALAVAAVPEGLATVVTVALALGVRRMADHGAIVRRLPAVETLGSTTVILTDKTGTLTENRMHLASALVDGRATPFAELPDRVREAAERVAVLCNDATLDPPAGDPLEVALLEAVGGARAAALRAEAVRLSEVPFDAETKRMAVIMRTTDGPRSFVKGAPEVIVSAATTVLTADGAVRALDRHAAERLTGQASEMASTGARTVALAFGELSGGDLDPDHATSELTLVAIVGLRDPLRAEAPDTIRQATDAGIRIVMVTGDHPGTAAAVAREAGLLAEGAPTTGVQLRRRGLPEDPLATGVYARVDPDQKLALVEELRERGHVVAVTGDGVNDAPALREADIGVAMGLVGSDVAREAGDMIVTDDNLATVVRAVREGRAIFDNIRKVVDYLVAGNLSEIAVVVVALVAFADLGVPLTPLQLLWINLTTDGMPALALGVDGAEPGSMMRPPRPRSERLLSWSRIGRLAGRGALLAAGALTAFVVERWLLDGDVETSRTVLFSTLMVAHLVYAFVARWPTRGVTSNPWLLGAVVSGIGLHAVIVSWAPAQGIFDTTALSIESWAIVAGCGMAGVALAWVGVRARVL